MIPASAGLLTKLKLVRVAAKIRVEGERDEVLLDVIRFDLLSGEPPGTIRRAGASRPRKRAAVSRGENDDRLVLLDRRAAGVRHVGVPVDVAPGTFAKLRFDDFVQPLEIRGVDLRDRFRGGAAQANRIALRTGKTAWRP